MAVTFSTFLKRGLVAGIVGGAAGALALWTLGEPAIRDALDVEAQQSDTHDETFSRGVQVLGGITAVLITGLVLGLVFTVVFVQLRHRVAMRTDAHLAVALGACGFLVQGVIPWFKYPPNPPGVGDPDTIDARTVSYLALITLALVALLLAHDVGVRLARRSVDPPRRWSATAAVVVAIVGVGYALLPAPDPVSEGFDADLLWRFRVASLAGLAAVWGVLSLTMAILCSGVEEHGDVVVERA
jgi:Probable cobalt transporter subunit (CbtA)